MYFDTHRTNPSWVTTVARDDDDNLLYTQLQPSDKKWVRLAEKYERDRMMTTCSRCQYKYNEDSNIYDLKSATKTFLSFYPEFLAEVLQICGKQLHIYRSDYADNIYLRYYQAGCITAQQCAEGIVKHPEELRNIIYAIERHDNSCLANHVLRKQVVDIANKQGLCPGYYKNQQQCRLGKTPVKLHQCNHNNLLWVWDYHESFFKLYDMELDKVCSLPNVYGNGEVCWGTGNNKPQHLAEVHQFFDLPFNSDLTLEVGDADDVCSVIEGYGLDETDYRRYYDEDDDYSDYDYDNAKLTTDDLLYVIRNGGENDHADQIPYIETMFTCDSCKAIVKIDIAADEQEEFGLSNNNDEDFVILFLVNETSDDVWECICPQQDKDDLLLSVDFNMLRNM